MIFASKNFNRYNEEGDRWAVTPATKFLGGIVMYNMAFAMTDKVKEAGFIAGLELEGVQVRCVRGRWLCYGLSEDHRAYIEKNASQFWAL